MSSGEKLMATPPILGAPLLFVTPDWPPSVAANCTSSANFVPPTLPTLLPRFPALISPAFGRETLPRVSAADCVP